MYMYSCIIFEFAVPKVDRFSLGGRKDLNVGGWGQGNPYRVRIFKSVRNIGPSLILTNMEQLSIFRILKES